MENLAELISTISRIKSSNNFKYYIDFIRFPFYRNLEINSTINFEFPLTVFIGQNGCGKSSCLHALYGAPRNHTPYSFWFDTSVDPIEYYDDNKKRHSFWYSYKHTDGSVKEVIKARIRRNNDPNYWETSRPLVWAGMQSRGRQDRDEPLDKKVIYIDFRAELSAFDKFFYFGNIKGASSRTKQEFIRRKSVQLKQLLTGSKQYYYTRAGRLNKDLRVLSTEELRWISFILGKKYLSGKFIEHKLFRNDGYTVIFKTSHAEYSEAFAGSGEVAVVRLVLRILEAETYSLILLDEPEVSLHPGAQSRLKFFLLEQIKLKKHQIILTSHSASIVQDLPKEAIKVFHQNPGTGRFLIKENLTPEEAFYHIEFTLDSRKNIIVEDVLAEQIIKSVLSTIGEEIESLFNIKFNPGGENVLKKEFITVYCRDDNSKNFIFFDGDQRPVNPHHNWKEFPTTDLTVSYLKDKIKTQTGEDIKFSVDSLGNSGNQEQQLELLKKYLDYYLSHVFYLPRNIPEEIIWDDDLANVTAQSILKPETFNQYSSEILAERNYKNKFSILSKYVSGENSSGNILGLQKQFIQKWLNKENQDFQEIKNAILQIRNT